MKFIRKIEIRINIVMYKYCVLRYAKILPQLPQVLMTQLKAKALLSGPWQGPLIFIKSF